MRRLFLIPLLAGLALGFAVAAAAQDDTTPEPDPTMIPAGDLDALLQRMQAAAERAEAAAERAEAALDAMQPIREEAAAAVERAHESVDLASGMFGLFEAMSGAVGLVVPFLAVAAGLLGFRRLESAQNELREARERFERDIRRREVELDTLRDELQNSAQKQREDASRASLALSLLPLGERQYRAQDYVGALDTYKRALDLDPNNPIIHYRMGYVYSQSGELERAEKFMARALELDPGLLPARAARGYAFRRMGDKMSPGVERDMMYNKAEENLLAALSASPKLMDEDGESWWGSLGGLYRRRGQIEQAIRAYEQATRVTPHSSYPFSNLALLYVVTHDRERMLQTYRRVERLAYGEVQAEVDNYWAYADLITARLALGKTDEIDELLEMTLDAAPPGSPYTLESLADTLERLAAALEPHEVPPVRRVIERINTVKAKHAQEQAAHGAD